MSKETVELVIPGSQEVIEVRPNFDYGNITFEHKEAVQEIVGLLKSMGHQEVAEIINARFKIVEPKRYDMNSSPFVQACMANHMYCGVQGYIQHGTDIDAVHYPLISMSEDIRKFEKLYEYIKNSK